MSEIQSAPASYNLQIKRAPAHGTKFIENNACLSVLLIIHPWVIKGKAYTAPLIY